MIQTDAPLPVTVDGMEIAIYKVGEQYFALEDVCPHAYALLSEGLIEDDTVECPLHGALFQISTGKCLSQLLRDLVKYPVRLEGEDILINL
jgi:3-phenylpropionate/trans-cinnamate dioxygenase ferredoxin subunit